MKFKTFKYMIESIQKELVDSCEKDRAISKALGGDSYVVTELVLLNDVLVAIENEYPTISDLVCDYIFEISPAKSFTINGIEYPLNIKTLWEFGESGK